MFNESLLNQPKVLNGQIKLIEYNNRHYYCDLSFCYF